MEDNELKTYLKTLIGIPYNLNPPSTHSLETGFNCYTWDTFVLSLKGKIVGELPTEFHFLKDFRQKLIKVTEPVFLDIPVFYLSELSTRHIGIMLDDNEFIHCSRATNGVAINYLDRYPWNSILRKIYRCK